MHILYVFGMHSFRYLLIRPFHRTVSARHARFLSPSPSSAQLVCAGRASLFAQLVDGRDTALFRRLVLGWINADFRVQGRIF